MRVLNISTASSAENSDGAERTGDPAWWRVHGVPLAILAVTVVAVLGLELRKELRVAGVIGFTLDDAWIHLTLARNLVQGHGFAVNPGESLPVSTSPSWTVMVAGCFALLHHPVLATLALSFLCTLVASCLLYFVMVGWTDSRLSGVICSELLLLNPTVLWGLASGMEVPGILLALCTLCFLYQKSQSAPWARWVGVPAALAFCVATRPELAVLAPLAWCESAGRILSTRRPGRWRSAIGMVLLQSLVFLAILSPYLLFNILTLGKWLPTTFYANAALRNVGLSAALQTHRVKPLVDTFVELPVSEAISMFTYLVESNVFFVGLLPLGFLFLTGSFGGRSRCILPAWGLLVLVCAMGVIMPTHRFINAHDRYYTVFIPFFALHAGLGWHVLRRQECRRILALVLVLIFFIFTITKRVPHIVAEVAEEVDTVNRLYVEMGKWADTNLTGPCLIAANDIGGISYFCINEERRLLDVMGLASPEIWPILHERGSDTRNVKGIKAFMEHQQVHYLIVSPHYYPPLTRDRHTFEQIATFPERFSSSHKWSPQNIYRCHWVSGADK